MRRIKGFTLIELLVVVVILLILSWIVISGIMALFGSGTKNLRSSGESACENKLRAASSIEIIEKAISAGAHYDIFVDGEKVAQVTGKVITTFGNVFTLTTCDGKKLAYEEEAKRIFSWSRSAQCFDGAGRVTGYLGEEKLNDLFSWGYIFHFYDASKTEIGASKKIGKSIWNYHQLYDKDSNADYTIDKQFKLTSDKYALTVLDRESSIPLEYAIFIVCIEDIIGDSN
jgi:prepilin-type N-terminal cleavage/methylation domain-containing protein